MNVRVLASRVAGYCLLAAMMVGCGQKSEQHSAAAPADVPSKLMSLFANDGTGATPGDLIFLNNVRLEPGPKDGIVYAVGAADQRLLVVINSPGKRTLKPGGHYAVRGSIQKTPSAKQMQKDWKMPKPDAEQVSKQGMYLEADLLMPKRK